MAVHRSILSIRLVRRHLSARCPHRVAQFLVLAQVGQGYDVSGIGGIAGFVGNPHLHAVDGDARGEIRKFLHPGIIMISKILGEEEVAVLLIIGYIQLKRSELHTAPGRYALRCTLLLRSYHLQLEFAKLHIGSNTKQTAGAFDERRVGREGDVARLNEFDDFIFLAVVLQFHVLCIEIEGGIGVVIQVHVHLIAHLSVDVEIDFLIKIHHRRLSVADRQRRIVDVFLVDTELEFGRTLCLHSDATRTEDFLCRSQVEVHI